MGTCYKPGTWNVICDLCGRKFKSDSVRTRWDGKIVCASDYETRHPMDFMKNRSEQDSVPFTNTEPPDTFV